MIGFPDRRSRTPKRGRRDWQGLAHPEPSADFVVVVAEVVRELRRLGNEAVEHLLFCVLGDRLFHS